MRQAFVLSSDEVYREWAYTALSRLTDHNRVYVVVVNQVGENGETGLVLARRHRPEVVVAFLRSLGISEKPAEIDAEGIEHHVSPETLAALARHTNR